MYVKFSCVFATFPCYVLGQAWYLIISIPDLCLLTYFKTDGQEIFTILSPKLMFIYSCDLPIMMAVLTSTILLIYCCPTWNSTCTCPVGLEGKYENVDGQAPEQLVYSRLWLQKLVFNTDYRLMQVKNIAECFLQYFRPSLSYHFPFRPLFYLFLSGRLRHFYCTIAHLWVFIRLRSS